VAPPERARACLESVREHLVTDAGALLLAPAWEVPDETIGYITRYAPGVRENGGVYTHAATWAIAAAAKMRDADLVGRLLAAIDPGRKDPERYQAEPYVLPGNVDGPQSAWPGRAGWTWYTGSAAWLSRVVSEWVLGVRPTWDGLLLDPCLPAGWERAALTRPWRGAQLEISIRRDAGLAPGAVRVRLDGRDLESNLLAPLPARARAALEVVCG
jgi:cellobiose phosphorylase